VNYYTQFVTQADSLDIDTEREKCMTFQRAWLRTPYAISLRKLYGWDRPFRKHTSLTLRDVRTRPLPNWHKWMDNNRELDGDQQ